VNHILLHEARQVWRAVLRAEAQIHVHQWQTWADSQVLSVQEPPAWVLRLSTAGSRKTALAAVEQDIGREVESELDPDALLIGFVVARHLRGELSTEAMWVKLNQTADVAEFLDSGKWQRYSVEVEAQGEPCESVAMRSLSQVASFANAKLSLLLSSPAEV